MSRNRRDASELIRMKMAQGYNVFNNNTFQYYNQGSNQANNIFDSYQGRLTPGEQSYIKNTLGYTPQNGPCLALCPPQQQQEITPPITQFGSYYFAPSSGSVFSRIDCSSQGQGVGTNGSLNPNSGNFTIEWFQKFLPNSQDTSGTVFSIGAPSSLNGQVLAVTLELSGTYTTPDVSNTYNLNLYWLDSVEGQQLTFFGSFTPTNQYFTTALLMNWNHFALVGTNNTSLQITTIQMFVNGLEFSPVIIPSIQSIYSPSQGPVIYNIVIPDATIYPYISLGNTNVNTLNGYSTPPPTNTQFSGYLTNFRYTTDVSVDTSGGGALYINFFIVPTIPLYPIMYTYTSNLGVITLISLTDLLLNGNISSGGSSSTPIIQDSSPYARSIQTTNIGLSGDSPGTVSLTPQQYGSFYFNSFYRTNSGYLNGMNGQIPFTPMYIDISNSPPLQIGTQSFTIEWWQWMDLYNTGTGTNPTQQQIIVFSYSNLSSPAPNPNLGTYPTTYPAFLINYLYDSSNNGAALGIVVNPSSKTPVPYWFGSFGTSVQGSPVIYSDLSSLNNTWVHVAFQGDGAGSNNFYVNGTQFGTSRLSNYNFTNSVLTSTMRIGDFAYYVPPSVGVPSSSFGTMSGYLTGFRISIGTMRYTGTFTPPTVPLANDTYTSLLLNNYLPDQTTVDYYKDYSVYTNTVTNSETLATLSTFCP